jgi:flagellar basal-body rod protein FlgB
LKTANKGGFLVLRSLLFSPQLNVLENSLAASSLRHKVISNNIANVNTPGFKKSDVVFESKLQEALTNHKLAMSQTNEKHLSGSQNSNFAPSIITDSYSVRTDGNNVDIDAEMASLAKNTIYYDAVAQQVSTYFSNLKSVIKGGQG